MTTSLIFGGAPLGGLFEACTDACGVSAVHRAVERGVRMFDTAPQYGAGLSEERLGKALQGVSGVDVITKVGRVVLTPNDVFLGDVEDARGSQWPEVAEGTRLGVDYSFAGVERSIFESERRLQVPIACLRVHDADTEERRRHLMEGRGMDALQAWKAAESGRTLSLGVNDAASALALLEMFGDHAFDSVMLAGCWNLLDQSGLPLLQFCAARSIPVHLAGVYASGLLVGGEHYRYRKAAPEVVARVSAWTTLCAAHGVPVPVVALAFARRAPAVTHVAVGWQTAAQVDDTMDWWAESACVPDALFKEARDQALIALDERN